MTRDVANGRPSVVCLREFKNQIKDGNRASTTIDSDGKIFESGCVDEFT